MKIALYSPYLPDHFGGGEKHMLTSAWYLSQKHEVDVLIPTDTKGEDTWKPKYESLFGLDLSRVNFVHSPIADRTLSPFETWNQTRSYDTVLCLTDGSLFFSGARNNILHIQIPYTFQKKSLIERLKLRAWNVKNANSEFTKRVVENAWKTKIDYLHYPYVQLPSPTHSPKKKKDIIAVGRFIGAGHASHSKGQDILINAFIAAQKNGQLTDSTLHLVGTVERGESAQHFVDTLKERAEGYPVRFWFDISQSELEKLYDSSSLFWHAAGWGINDQDQPEKVEHFGMTTIEAMAHKCIPLVLPKGGSKEIITDTQNGFFFSSEQELIDISATLFDAKTDLTHLQNAAYERASDFSLERFCSTLDRMVKAQ